LGWWGPAGAPARGPPAAGSALARCPIELFVPCHRVVRAGPDLGSYGGHDERRRYLLELEGARIPPFAARVRR
jgi:methylated-DNA-[protein]-cysteine S-methyltransferase